jgi:hypothetical protein
MCCSAVNRPCLQLNDCYLHGAHVRSSICAVEVTMIQFSSHCTAAHSSIIHVHCIQWLLPPRHTCTIVHVRCSAVNTSMAQMHDWAYVLQVYSLHCSTYAWLHMGVALNYYYLHSAHARSCMCAAVQWIPPQRRCTIEHMRCKSIHSAAHMLDCTCVLHWMIITSMAHMCDRACALRCSEYLHGADLRSYMRAMEVTIIQWSINCTAAHMLDCACAPWR